MESTFKVGVRVLNPEPANLVNVWIRADDEKSAKTRAEEKLRKRSRGITNYRAETCEAVKS